MIIYPRIIVVSLTSDVLCLKINRTLTVNCEMVSNLPAIGGIFFKNLNFST